MANVFIQDSTMTAIGDAIRAKTGGTDLILPADMATAISGITTGGGDSGGGGHGVWDATNGLSGLPSLNTSTTISGTVSIDLPEDAIVRFAVIKADVTTNTGTKLGAINITPDQEFTETVINNGRKTVTFGTYSIANSSGAYASYKNLNNVIVLYEMPNTYMENGILYALPECKGLFPGTASGYGSYRTTCYMEGIDMRGSQVNYLPRWFATNHTELKKIWFSEVFSALDSEAFSYCPSTLEEIHFTAPTPSTTVSKYGFDGIPTTCKMYVPAGSLSAYTSAANYPSATKYTYIEE